MPLGIVSNLDFETERNNSDSSVEVIPSQYNNELKESVVDGPIQIIPDDNTEDENSNREEHRASVITSSQIVGRHNYIPNVPQSLRKILAEEATVSGNKSAQHLMDNLGMSLSQPTISTYKRGEVSPNISSNQSKDLYEYLNGRKNKIGKRALNKLTLALSLLDENKMTGLEARELSGVAKDMAIIAEKMEPKSKEQDKISPVQFVLMAPTINSENHYETVIAKDNY